MDIPSYRDAIAASEKRDTKRERQRETDIDISWPGLKASGSHKSQWCWTTEIMVRYKKNAIIHKFWHPKTSRIIKGLPKCWFEYANVGRTMNIDSVGVHVAKATIVASLTCIFHYIFLKFFCSSHLKFCIEICMSSYIMLLSLVAKVTNQILLL